MRLSLAAVVWALLLALAMGQAPVPAREGIIVAVGYDSRKMVSRDGQLWEERARSNEEGSAEEGALLDIAFGAGRFVAVGGGTQTGRILSSTDGRVWQAQAGVRGQVATIAFGNGRFVATHGGELMSSTDGLSFRAGQRLEWKGRALPLRSASGDTEAGFRFVIVGEIALDGESRSVCWRGVTADGETWDHTALDTPPINDIAYGVGNFVVVGPNGLIESSHDGQTWQQRASAPGEEFSRVIWTGKRFLVSGGKVAWSSPDGFTWSKEAVPLPCNVAWAEEGVLGIGFSWGGDLWTSKDLIDWKKVTMPTGPPLRAVAVGR